MESLKERLLEHARWHDKHGCAASAVLLREASEALGVSPPASINNGNPYIFCDYVDGELHGCACIRGTGHNGPHALSLPPHPHGPVILHAGSGEPERSER